MQHAHPPPALRRQTIGFRSRPIRRAVIDHEDIEVLDPEQLRDEGSEVLALVVRGNDHDRVHALVPSDDSMNE
jgi:hypothetical protein